MTFLIYIQKKIYRILIAAIAFSFLMSCGIYQPSDARKVSPNAQDRVRKNLEEGRGFTLMGQIDKEKQGGTFSFASSNELWRASLYIFDFISPISFSTILFVVLISGWNNVL